MQSVNAKTTVESIAAIDGLYVLGVPWLYRADSGIICGIVKDAEITVEMIRQKLQKNE